MRPAEEEVFGGKWRENGNYYLGFRICIGVSRVQEFFGFEVFEVLAL